MARRAKQAGAPSKDRIIIGGKDWDDLTDEERDRTRERFARIAIDVSLRPLEAKYGPARLAAALRAVLQLWKEEQAGHSEPFLTPLMEREIPAFVFGRVVEDFLATIDSEQAHEPVVVAPLRYVI